MNQPSPLTLGDAVAPVTVPTPTASPVGGREALVARWAERHGVDTACRLAEAEDLADAVIAEITPANTRDTYAKSWRVWERFFATAGLPVREGARGSLVAFVTWMLREGQVSGKGYAPSSAGTGRRGSASSTRRATPPTAPAWR